MTAELVAVAEASAGGRLVSVLEGGYQVNGGPLSSLAIATAAHVRTLMDPALVGSSWSAADGPARFEATVAAERAWTEERARRREEAAAVAKAAAEAAAEATAGGEGEAAGSGAAVAYGPAPVEQQENGAPVKRSKRRREEVDYVALQAKMEADEAAGSAGAGAP